MISPVRSLGALLLAALLLLSGCSSRREVRATLAQEFDLFGLTLYAEDGPSDLLGTSATREPCMEGYEDVFEQVGLRIGYTRSGVVRHLVTLHSGTGAYGARVGDPLPIADETLRRRGFVPEPTRNAYRNDLCRIILLVDKEERVFGMRLEGLDALL